MSRPKVLVTRPGVPQEGIDMLKAKCDVEIYDQDKPIERDALLKGIKGKDALFCLLTDPIDKEVIEAAGPQLKAIATMSVGFDHIDTKECKARNIPVSNTPDVSTDSVAEMTVTLLLAAGRRLMDAASAIKKGEWVYSWSPLWLCGQGLTNATVGIVGMGRIGQGVMKRLLPFGIAKVLYFDVFHPIKPAEDMGAQYVEFEELVKQSDFIVAMCNLSEQTKDLFNAKAFNLMKPTAVFVNTSRGGVVNQEDLFDALKNKKIRAAGLDVMVPEPLPKDHPLTTLDNIILTPHVGSAEVSVRVQMAKLAAENILSVLDGKPMVSPVPLG
ncbi:glyoxylate reductase/hydroxypyruvate reductase [Parasteatoda tepidariorum]|uniref:Glyoxylate reductase/hydroxypyruvate reductase n=1 Tax=Parasteatoda tepidariorum TaxID=114398 RepID=A0A2L2Y319_PARTP|nr:glyoxylate reductase/hydroxypyruvate reductase [Parasteatoda tepidariorum]